MAGRPWDNANWRRRKRAEKKRLERDEKKRMVLPNPQKRAFRPLTQHPDPRVQLASIRLPAIPQGGAVVARRKALGVLGRIKERLAGLAAALNLIEKQP